ncbi:alpha/beta fold hydrolase [Salinibacterium sp. ZJ70]|uniref:alpha/beta fold hydrolase n=1 Tax=Salinibacterium sp. ZJ70 TaxID=2708084 RepID=UPI0014205EA7|nr:alpha/beta hydrolase [Salinibacterium sp. ZJ70]
MDVILVPGFWLRGDSWGDVIPVLEAAGHRAHPITRPGLGEGDDAAAVTLEDQVAAIVWAIDEVDGPVALVAHSGGGPMAYAAAERRLDRVAHIVYVDTWPLPAGAAVSSDLPVIDGVIPLPDWSMFDDEDLRDLDEGTRARFASIAVPEPESSARDTPPLGDELARRAIPSTVIATSRSESEYREWFEAPFFAELVALENVSFVDLPTGHWPQLTRPAELGAAIVAALG